MWISRKYKQLEKDGLKLKIFSQARRDIWKQKWNNPSGKDFGAVIGGPSTTSVRGPRRGTQYDQGPLAVIWETE